MRTYDVILKKRNGQALTTPEINYLIDGYMSGTVPDYQMAAFAMTVFFQGMEPREISDLTMAIVSSGDHIDLSGISGKKVDKHSTGGVGDKTTLVVGPLVAAAGVPVAKMSGRGLGHTGGTIDKLESIPGFKTALTREQFIDNVNRIKIAIGGQTGNLAPADKKLYALRDVTATVDSIPLIASSIMSKKLAAGADAIVLDVKTGSGAFMKSIEDAVALAKAMVAIGGHVGRETVALITDMDQPLGQTVGNVLEVIEAVECLKGQGPPDLQELSITLASQMVFLAGRTENLEQAKVLIEKSLKDGSGLAKLRDLLENQGGDLSYIDNLDLLPSAAGRLEIPAHQEGFVAGIQAEQIGVAAMTVGAGRETKESDIDLSVGIKLHKKTGDQVRFGERLATLYYNDFKKAEQAKQLIIGAYKFQSSIPLPRKLILGVVTSQGVTMN